MSTDIKEPSCTIITKPCGCLAGAYSNVPTVQKHFAKDAAALLRKGCLFQTATAEFIRSYPAYCESHKPTP